MKKILPLILSLLLFVGCSSNEQIDNSSNEQIDNSSNEQIDNSSNEVLQISVGNFPGIYIPEAKYRVDLGIFESNFGERSYFKGLDEDYRKLVEGVIPFLQLIVNFEDIGKEDYHLNGFIKYVSDIVGNDVSQEIKNKINSNIENCQSRYLSGETDVYYKVNIMEHDIFNIILEVSVRDNPHYDSPDYGSMTTAYGLTLEGK